MMTRKRSGLAVVVEFGQIANAAIIALGVSTPWQGERFYPVMVKLI
jgi:hypothetical protein